VTQRNPDYELTRRAVGEVNGLSDTPLWDWSILQAAAREVGYALLLHGSLLRDVDIVAIPWTEDHDEDALVQAFHDYPGVIAHDEEDWRGWRTFTALFGGDRYFDVKIARIRKAES
jgi:hypothetical protein